MAFSFTELLKKQFPLAELGVDTRGSKRMPESSPFPSSSASSAFPMGGLIEALGGVTGIPEGAGFKMADLFDNDRWEQVSGSEFGIPENPRRGEVRMTNRYIPREYGADTSIIKDQAPNQTPYQPIDTMTATPYAPPVLEGRNPPVPRRRIYDRWGEVNGGFRNYPDVTTVIKESEGSTPNSQTTTIKYGSNPMEGRNPPAPRKTIFERLGEVHDRVPQPQPQTFTGMDSPMAGSRGSDRAFPPPGILGMLYGSNPMEGGNSPVPAAYMSKGNPVRSAPYQGNPGARLGPNWRGPERYSPQRGFDLNRGFKGFNLGALTPYLSRIGTGAAGLLLNSEALGSGMDMLTPESAVDEMTQQQGMQEYNEAQENFEPYAPLDVIIDSIKEFYKKKLDFGGA